TLHISIFTIFCSDSSQQLMTLERCRGMRAFVNVGTSSKWARCVSLGNQAAFAAFQVFPAAPLAGCHLNHCMNKVSWTWQGKNAAGMANTGADEANHMLQMASPWMRPGYLPPVLDLEAGISQRTSAELTTFCIDFSDRIYNVMGIRPMIYINGNYAGYVTDRKL